VACGALAHQSEWAPCPIRPFVVVVMVMVVGVGVGVGVGGGGGGWGKHTGLCLLLPFAFTSTSSWAGEPSHLVILWLDYARRLCVEYGAHISCWPCVCMYSAAGAAKNVAALEVVTGRLNDVNTSVSLPALCELEWQCPAGMACPLYGGSPVRVVWPISVHSTTEVHHTNSTTRICFSN
jgi:hypothetical protein